MTMRDGRRFNVNKRHSRQRLDVSELSVGMYVVELDRPWIDSPFLFQGFLLENADDIIAVQDICKWVYVDVVEEEWVEADVNKPTGCLLYTSPSPRD